MRLSIALTGLLSLSFWACTSDNTPPGTQPPPTTNTGAGFLSTNLVSDISDRATNTDAHLVNPWGLAFGPDTYLWVANAGSASLTVYDASGLAQPATGALVVSLPPGSEPTGMVFNGSDKFQISVPVTGGTPGATVQTPASFIAALTDGSIVAWNKELGTNATVVVQPDAADAYTGLELADDSNLGALLYAANFKAGKIEVYDGNFKPVTLDANAFLDQGTPALPSDYAPFSVHFVDGQIYVAYAQHEPGSGDEIKGPGKGYVSIFSTGGSFVKRFVSTGQLDAPWGIALAPSGFGKLGNAILIGNFGDGRINAYQRDTGTLIDTLRDQQSDPVENPGLWSIAFGNGRLAGAATDLFFTAGIEDEQHGLFGRIRPMEVTPTATP